MNRVCFNIALMFLAGCMLMPAYHRPQAPVASRWPGDQREGGNKILTADIGWREFFTDARLQKLIELALENNRDLRIAMLNVEQVRAQYRIFNHAFLPSFDGEVSSVRERTAGTTGSYTTSRKYTVEINTAYELDLFGHIRSLKAQALERYFATQEAKQSAQITLICEVAIQYLNERALDEELTLSTQTLQSVKAYDELIKSSYDLGNTSELDLRSAEAQVQTALANIANYQRQRNQAEDALVFLIGQPWPDDLPPAQPMEDQKLLSDLPAGLPSDLLEHRPDILEAEHQLKAANANIGTVRADFFPKITLTASDGTSTVQLAKLFAPGTQAWNFSPQISVPIFDRNTHSANLDAAQLGKSIEIAHYEKAIQNAFREVSDALVATSTFNDQITALSALVEAQKKRYQLADERYRNGADSYLTVLTAQQDLYTAQQNFIQIEFARLSNLVSFYKALGGGWQEHSSN